MLNNLSLALQGGYKVLLAGLILGAGLPTIFAFGIRSLAWGSGGSAEVDIDAKPHPLGRAVATLCFALVLVSIAVGISIIVASGFGKAVSFEHIYPTFVAKK